MKGSGFGVQDLGRIIDQLFAARERHLVHRSTPSLLSSLDRVVALWLDPSSQERREAEVQLSATTGLSPEMIRHTLPLIFQAYRAERLEALLQDELGNLNALDTFVSTPNGQQKAFGPALVTQVLAGNLPGAGLDSVIFALLVKSAVLVKTSSAEPLLPTLFARSLARVDPEVGACLAVVQWSGGNMALEDLAFTRAEVVIASGSDESLAAIRSRVRGAFIGYGHKVSFSVIGKEMLVDAAELAERAAYDVALFDQQGCLSPQLIYVEYGGSITPGEFAVLLAQALERWQHLLPRGNITPEASIAIQRVRNEAEWQSLAGKEVRLHASPGNTAWTVIYEADSRFVPSPLYRTVRVKPLASLVQLPSLLVAWRSHLEAAGVAMRPDEHQEVAGLLGRLGVSRICPVGTMQTPPLGWRHGGRPRIADLVQWTGIETRNFKPET